MPTKKKSHANKAKKTSTPPKKNHTNPTLVIAIIISVLGVLFLLFTVHQIRQSGSTETRSQAYRRLGDSPQNPPNNQGNSTPPTNSNSQPPSSRPSSCGWWQQVLGQCGSTTPVDFTDPMASVGNVIETTRQACDNTPWVKFVCSVMPDNGRNAIDADWMCNNLCP